MNSRIPSSALICAMLLLSDLGSLAQTAPAPLAPVPRFFPQSGATGVCPDTPLRITFQTSPIPTAGKIQIFDTATNAVLETIDLAVRTATKPIGGLGDFKYYPVIAAGNELSIYPRGGDFSYGKSYYVTFDGVPGVDTPASWRFTTKAAGPTKGTAKITVAADGSGDFCTIQGAIDSIPDGNTSPTTIFIRKGTYNEIIALTNKHAITLLGEDRKQTVIAYANNENFNKIPGNPFGSDKPDPSSYDPAKGEPVYHRGVLIAHRCNDLTLANLTIRNTTPHGGSQAETIILNGTTSASAILVNVDLYSFQDTLQINGQAYLKDCYIEGDVDFMWGTGPCFFENCQCRAVTSRAYYTQIRNQPTNHGFVYLHCIFDGKEGVTGAMLSRIGSAKYPASEMVLMDCVLGSAIAPAAWSIQGAVADVHFWEYNSKGLDGKPIDVSQRLAASRQIKSPDDAAIIASYSDPKYVLGHDWNPGQSAIFTTLQNDRRER